MDQMLTTRSSRLTAAAIAAAVSLALAGIAVSLAVTYQSRLATGRGWDRGYVRLSARDSICCLMRSRSAARSLVLSRCWGSTMANSLS